MIFLFLRCFLSVPTLVWVAVLHSCAVTSCTVVFAHLVIVPHASIHPSFRGVCASRLLCVAVLDMLMVMGESLN